MRLYSILTVVVCLLVLPVAGQKAKKDQYDNELIVPGQFILKLKNDASISQLNQRAVPQLSFQIEGLSRIFKDAEISQSGRTSTTGIDFTKYYLLKADKQLNTAKVIQELSSNGLIEYIEPVYMDRSTYIPNDTRVTTQDHLATISAFDAWNITKGSADIIVAIVDSGVDYEHEDLASNIYVNTGEIEGNGIDDDNDGFIDNYYGWDFVGADFENIVHDNDPIAQANNISHGTRVVGYAAAATDNNIGVAGVGFNTKYMALKCSADNDTRSNGLGFVLNAPLAVKYAADHGAHVINMSYGGPSYSQFTQDIMTYAALEKDVVLIAAAGNGGTDIIQYPAGYEHVIAVAATNNDDTKASFSEFGSWVDISAPGVGVLSTNVLDQYEAGNGTSFSSPITAGAAALLRAHFPDYNQFQISQTLKHSADDISSQNSNFIGQLGGRLNVNNALTIPTSGIRLTASSILNGNGDVPLKSEKATIDLSLINELAETSSLTEITLTEISAIGIVFDANAVTTIGVIGNGEEKIFEAINTFDVPSDIPFNTSIQINVSIKDSKSGYEENFLIEAIVNPLKTAAGPTPFLLGDGGDFETSDGGFASGSISGGINVWERGVPTNTLIEVNSGTNAWKTDLDGNLTKATYQCALQTPAFDLSDVTREFKLSFFKSMESEFCNAPSAVQLQYSLDGLSWTRLGSRTDALGTNWYNKDPNTACQIAPQIFADQEGWLGNFENEYTAYNISELAGNSSVTFRFVLSVSADFVSDINDDGFMVDDFQIEALDPTASFFAPNQLVYLNQPVEFNFISAGAQSYTWEFGDGTNSTEKNPTHAYDTHGIYDVTLSIVTEQGVLSNTLEDYIQVLPSNTAPFLEEDGGDFESNFENFAALNVSGSAFELGMSSIAGKDGTSSGSNAWVTGIEETQYQDESEAYLYTSEFDFTALGEYALSFQAKYAFENAWDGFIVEYTTDQGTTWNKLGDKVTAGWYDVISDPQAVFGDQVPIFSGNTNGNFELKSMDVSFLGSNSTVGFRFVFLTDANTTDVGLALDDFSLTGPDVGPAVAAFSASSVETCTDTEVIFTNESSGSYTAISWNFGDNATPESASGIGPHAVTYSESGVYTVTMTLEGIENGEQIEEKVDYIAVGLDPSPTITAEKQGLEEFLLTASEGESYQWYNNDVLIDGATSQTYLANEIGMYTVEITNGVCSKFNTSQFTFSLVSGLISEEVGMTAYPNPVTNGKINVSITDNITSPEVGIKFYSLTGQVVLSIKEPRIDASFNKNYDLSTFEKGIYYISIEMNNEIFTQKIIVK